MSYLLEDMEKWAGDRETFQLSREELNRKIDMRNRTLWHDARDIEAGMMLPKEKIKPKFQTIKKRSFTHLTEDSDYVDKHLEKSNKRRVQRQEFIMEKHRKINQAKQEARDKESEEMWASYERDLKKERRNQLIKPIALAGAGAAAIGGGAYLYNRYKKKKRAEAEQEKTAARQFKDFEDFKNSMPKDKKKAANLKFSPDDFEWGEYDAGLGYNFEDSRRWHYDNYKADPKEKESIDNLYRSMHEDHQNFTKQQAAAKGSYEKALARGKTMQRAGLGVSAGGAGLALLAGSRKLPKNLKAPIAAIGTGAAIGGLGARRKGRSLTEKEREKYNQLEIDYGKRHEEKISSPAFKNYWNSVHDHWGDWGQWMGPRSNKE